MYSASPGSCAETPLFGASAVQDWLIVSTKQRGGDRYNESVLRLFKGMPQGGDAAFAQLLAEGGFEVAARLVNGSVEFVSITSVAGLSSLRLESGLTPPVRVTPGTVRLTHEAHGVVRLEGLRLGEGVVLFSGQGPRPPFVMQPVLHGAAEWYWGGRAQALGHNCEHHFN